MEELRIIGYIAAGLLVLYLGLRFLAERAVKKVVRTELDSVVNSDRYKVKGRFE